MSQPLRIAVADDEPDMREYFARILPLLGYQVVVVARDGDELLAGCRQTPPDLIITDVRMPGLDGMDASLRVHREVPVPVLLVTAYHDPALVHRAEMGHVMAWLVKPIRQADLAAAIPLAVRRFETLRAQQV